MDLNERIKEALKFDSFNTAEKIGKGLCKGDIDSIGLSLHIQNTKRINELMDLSGDTKFSEETESYKEKIEKFGFVEVYREPFTSQDKQETYYIHYHPEYGTLIDWDTFKGSRNGANMHYNILFLDNKVRSNFSSGHILGSGKILFDKDLNKIDVNKEFKPYINFIYQPFNSLSLSNFGSAKLLLISLILL